MKFTSLSMLAAGMAMPSLTNAQTLEQFWNLEEPSFDYLDRTFAMTYKFSNGIASTAQTEAKLYLYLNLDDPNDVLNCFQADSPNEYGGDSLDIYQGDFLTSGDTEFETGQKETVFVDLDPLTVATDLDVFTDNLDGTNLIAFCVRYGLKTPAGGGGYEVNFLETLVELRVDLKGNFTVTDIVVAPKDKIKRTANIDYGLTAFQCTGKDEFGAGIEKVFVEGEGTFNQGDVITVCVEPEEVAKNDGVYMKEVELFEYVLLEDFAPFAETGTRQLAIDIDNVNSGTRGAMFGLTNIDACLGEIACKIETILFATFYTRAGTVVGAGVATMQFGTIGGDGNFAQRKLRGGDASRALQADEAASGDFDVNFEIASNDSFERPSSASSSLSILALVGSAAAVLMM